MSMQTRKIETLVIDLETKPGSLAKVYSALREARINIIASWARETTPNGGEAMIYPSDLSKTRDVLAKLGKTPRQGWACYTEGEDQLGVYADLLQKIAAANVNLDATAATSVNGRFVTAFFAKDKDQSALCRVLGC